MKRICFLISVLILISFSCSENHQSRISSTNHKESFESFIEKFETDKSFQLDRIKFPVHGRYVDNETAGTKNNDSMIWTKDNWQIIKKLNKEDLINLKVKITKTVRFVNYRIESKDGGFLFETKYKNIKGKWYLVNLTDIMI